MGLLNMWWQPRPTGICTCAASRRRQPTRSLERIAQCSRSQHRDRRLLCRPWSFKPSWVTKCGDCMQAARLAEEAGGHAAAQRELAATAAAAAATQERLQRELAKANADLAEAGRALGEARAAEAAAAEVRGEFAQGCYVREG
jgi:hypothetical protein